MTLYKRSIYISLIITVLAFIGVIYLNEKLLVNNKVEAYWAEILVGIFSSAFLLTISSIIGYFHERKRSMYYFKIETQAILDTIDRLVTGEDIQSCCLELGEYKIEAWKSIFYDFNFFRKKNKQYIEEEIYNPINRFITNCAQYNHMFLASKDAESERKMEELNAILGMEEDDRTENGERESTPFCRKINDTLEGKYMKIMKLKR